MPDWRKRGRKTDDVIYFPGSEENKLAQVHFAYVWDLDKTYLDTHFGSLMALWKSATEKADLKKNVPGTVELVSCLKQAWIDQLQIKPHLLPNFPIFFITASPPQLEAKFRKKFSLDDVEPLGLFCKDNLINLHPRRLWRLSKQVGYKLQALLQMRSYLADDLNLILFGDDGESDTVIYSLFSDICARRMNSEKLRIVLNHFSVLDEQVDQILRLQELIPHHDPVKRIYINLVEDTDTDYYLKFGRRCLPTENSFQIALDMLQENLLALPYVARVGLALKKNYNYSTEQLDSAFLDLIRRGVLAKETIDWSLPYLQEHKILSADLQLINKPKLKTEIDSSFEPWIIDKIEYLNDYR